MVGLGYFVRDDVTKSKGNRTEIRISYMVAMLFDKYYTYTRQLFWAHDFARVCHMKTDEEEFSAGGMPFWRPLDTPERE